MPVLITFTPNGGGVGIRPVNRRTLEHAWGFSKAQPELVEWIDEIPSDACVWDIGANVGMVSLMLATASKSTKVLAFEPGASSFAALNANIELNKMSDSVRAYCIAFTDRSRLDTLNMRETCAASAMHGFGCSEDQFGESINVNYKQGSIGFSIDEFMDRFHPPAPTHVKIDVDGLELQILKGGRKTLSRNSVESMAVEVEGDADRVNQIHEIMREMGFVARPKRSDEQRNIVFARDEDGGCD